MRALSATVVAAWLWVPGIGDCQTPQQNPEASQQPLHPGDVIRAS